MQRQTVGQKRTSDRRVSPIRRSSRSRIELNAYTALNKNSSSTRSPINEDYEATNLIQSVSPTIFIHDDDDDDNDRDNINNNDTFAEQKVCIKFCVSNGFSCAESLKMLIETYGGSVLSKTQVYEWYKAFKSGRDIVKDLPRAITPKTDVSDENIAKVKVLVLENCRYSMKELAHELNISYESVRQILVNNLGMRRIASKLVPKKLNFLQEKYRKAVAEDMLSRVASDTTFMQRIITGDEIWVYEYDNQTNQRSSSWRYQNEVLLTVFFDYRGVVHYEFLPQGQTANKEYYLDVMKRLQESVCQQRPDLWKENSWILHHDNTPSHKANIVSEFLKSTNMIEQASYSPDMAPCDFFLFPKLNLPFRGTRFVSIEAIKEKLTNELKSIPAPAYKICMDDWISRWRKCVLSKGDYFEDDKMSFDD